MKPLDRIFNAQSIAIIGASRDEKKRGYQVINALLEERFEGKIFPVNPREETILGMKCHPSILDIKQPIDVAFVATPSHTIPDIIREECASGADR